MTFTTLDELIKEFQRHPQPSSGRLRLDHYLALEATNEAAAQFLYNLELKGLMPLTVTWFSEAGWEVRLYQNHYKSDMIDIPHRMFGMEIQCGSGRDCLVMNNDNSFLDCEVVTLPEETLKFFRMLGYLADDLISHQDAPLELGSEAWRYRQII
jgi:hypothetical protein